MILIGPLLVLARNELRAGAKFRPTTFGVVRTGSLRRVATNSCVVLKGKSLSAIEYCRIDIRDEPKRIATISTVALDRLRNKSNLRADKRRRVAIAGIHHGLNQLCVSAPIQVAPPRASALLSIKCAALL